MCCPKCNGFGFYTITHPDGMREGFTCKCHVEGKVLEQDKDDYSPFLRSHTISDVTPKKDHN